MFYYEFMSDSSAMSLDYMIEEMQKLDAEDRAIVAAKYACDGLVDNYESVADAFKECEDISGDLDFYLEYLKNEGVSFNHRTAAALAKKRLQYALEKEKEAWGG